MNDITLCTQTSCCKKDCIRKPPAVILGYERVSFADFADCECFTINCDLCGNEVLEKEAMIDPSGNFVCLECFNKDSAKEGATLS